MDESTSLASEREQLATDVDRLAGERTRWQREVDAVVLRIHSMGREVTRLETRVVERKVAHQARAESRERLEETVQRGETALRDTGEWIGRREQEIETAQIRRQALAAEIETSEAVLAERLKDEEAARAQTEILRDAYEQRAQDVQELGRFHPRREERSPVGPRGGFERGPGATREQAAPAAPGRRGSRTLGS